MIPNLKTYGTVNVLVIASTTTAAGAAMWGLWNNGGSRQVVIPRIVFQMSFGGTGAGSVQRCEWVKATAVTAITDGVAVTPVEGDVRNPAVGFTAKVLDTGLTTTGITGALALYTASWQRVTWSATATADTVGPVHTVDFTAPGIEGLVLQKNEILALRNGPTNASVAGDTITGMVYYYEKT